MRNKNENKNEFIEKKHGKYKIRKDYNPNVPAYEQYVIYYKEGQKPLCIGGLRTIEQCMSLIDMHQEEIEMRINRPSLTKEINEKLLKLKKESESLSLTPSTAR